MVVRGIVKLFVAPKRRHYLIKTGTTSVVFAQQIETTAFVLASQVLGYLSGLDPLLQPRVSFHLRNADGRVSAVHRVVVVPLVLEGLP